MTHLPIQSSLFFQHVDRSSLALGLDLDLDLDLENVGDKNYLTHNFHPYPAKFIPQIPSAILERYALKPCTILDPFCGSGTVAVEASLRGHHCIANDLNPIATLITRAKTAALRAADRKELELLLLDIGGSGSTLCPAPVPRFKNRELWFSKTMLLELAALKGRIDSLPVQSPAHILALCAFSAIVVKCSNQESETHWRSVHKELPKGFAINAFSNRLCDMVARSTAYSRLKRGSVDVTTGSALRLTHLSDGAVDVIITSPPYANSHDYYLYHKLRMFWLGFDHYAVQRAETGSRHRHSDLAEPIENYFTEMRDAFLESARLLRPGGILAIVIGDSIYKATCIDMGSAFVELAADVALSNIYRYDFDQRRYTSSFQRGLKTAPKRSHILVFKK